jgi:sulfotransferase
MYHFITGLPRAGSTLLSAILNQNPKFQASISGPLARFTRAVIEQSSAQGGYKYQCPESKRKNIIHGMFANYYDDETKTTFFDTNRGWSFLSPLVKTLYPSSKIIVCVRPIPEILDSFENLVQKNPLSVTTMFPADSNVYTRSQHLMSDSGPVGFAYTGLKQLLCSNEKTSTFIIEYEQLAKNPEQTIRALYKFINEEYYEHDYSNVETSYDEFDNDVGLKGLHTTRKVVSYIPRDTILPPDIAQHYNNMSIWR